MEKFAKQNRVTDIIHFNRPKDFFQDNYHLLLKMPWTKLILFCLLYFFSINLTFAFLYSLDPTGLIGSDGSLKSFFFFSVHTFSTVGYGTISPVSNYTNSIVTLEVFTGMISMALVTGILFSKFSLPSAKILFSNNAIIHTVDAKNMLIFRLANLRHNQVINANIHVTALMDEVSSEKNKIRRLKDLKLVRNFTPVFSLSLLVFHPIDEASPLFGLSQEELQNLRLEILVTVIGVDGTNGQTIYSIHSYQPQDIIRDGYFEDVLTINEKGQRVLNYANFHKVKTQ